MYQARETSEPADPHSDPAAAMGLTPVGAPAPHLELPQLGALQKKHSEMISTSFFGSDSTAYLNYVCTTKRDYCE